MTDDAEPYEPSDDPGAGAESDQVEDWLSLPLFDMSDGEAWEELATYGVGALRAAARGAQALAAHRAVPPDQASWTRWMPRLRACVGTLLVAALVAAIAVGGWPRHRLPVDTADASRPLAAAPGGLAGPLAVASTLTTLPLLHPPAVPSPRSVTDLPAKAPVTTSSSPPAHAGSTATTTRAASAGATSNVSSGPTPGLSTLSRGSSPLAPPSLAPPPLALVAPDAPLKDPLPVGKFEWVPSATTPAQAPEVTAQAAAGGLNDLVVGVSNLTRSASLLDALIPAAHQNGLRLLAAASPSLTDPAASAAQAVALASFSARGQHLDGLMTELSAPLDSPAVAEFAAALRSGVGLAYPLVAEFPAAAATGAGAPDAATLADFDALAPVVALTPGAAGLHTEPLLGSLGSLGQPVLPVATGAAATEGALSQFMAVADRSGAVGVGLEPSVAASRRAAAFEVPSPMSGSPLFDLDTLDAANLLPSQIRAMQAELASLGLPVAITGALDADTTAALATFQQASQLPPSGLLTAATGALLLAPVAVLAP